MQDESDLTILLKKNKKINFSKINISIIVGFFLDFSRIFWHSSD
jgi:hypothetical protein